MKTSQEALEPYSYSAEATPSNVWNEALRVAKLVATELGKGWNLVPVSNGGVRVEFYNDSKVIIVSKNYDSTGFVYEVDQWTEHGYSNARIVTDDQTLFVQTNTQLRLSAELRTQSADDIILGSLREPKP